MKAVWNDTTIASSDQTIIVERNHYFPPDSVRSEYLEQSEKHSTCPWKGVASYFHVKINDAVNEDSAWYYAEPKEAVRNIKDYISFYRGIKVID